MVPNETTENHCTAYRRSGPKCMLDENHDGPHVFDDPKDPRDVEIGRLRSSLLKACGWLDQANEMLKDESIIDDDDLEDMRAKVANLREEAS